MIACRSCGARIQFAETENGRRMPLDGKPNGNGNIRLITRAGKAPLAFVLAGEKLATFRNFYPNWPLYTSHFATCPSAAAHRKGKPS